MNQIPILLADDSKGFINVSIDSDSILFNYPCSTYDICTNYWAHLFPGRYLFEVWGAQGGSFNKTFPGSGGLGGYSSGMINFTIQTTLLFYVGGQGVDYLTSGTQKGGFNGGGNGLISGWKGCGGGGASDIRLYTGVFSSRIIVAGGGGGSGYGYGEYSNTMQHLKGGSGGGLTGGQGIYYKTDSRGFYTFPGNQTSPGYDYGSAHSYATRAEFGIGGSWTYTGNGWHSAGGGGGWYGGAAGSCYGSSGSGGSGYVFTSASHIPSGYTMNSIYQLYNTSIKSGNDQFPKPDKSGIETGHSGHGAIRITLIESYEEQSSPQTCIPQRCWYTILGISDVYCQMEV